MHACIVLYTIDDSLFISSCCGIGTASLWSEGGACRLEAVFLYGPRTLMGPCPRCALLVASHPCAASIMDKDHSWLWDGVHAGVHPIQGRRVLATVGVDPNEIHGNWYKIGMKFVRSSSLFMLTAAIQQCRGLPLLVSNTIWPWWVCLGRDFRWMMWNETRG